MEETTWAMINDHLYRIFYQSGDSNGIELARAAYVKELENTLRGELADAHQAITQSTASAMNATKHQHRRNVAGYHQVITLLKQGRLALEAAVMDDVIIFNGHRCVFSTFIITSYR